MAVFPGLRDMWIDQFNLDCLGVDQARSADSGLAESQAPIIGGDLRV